MITFLIRKIVSIAGTLLFVTAALYGLVMMTPPEVRATLYMPSSNDPRMTEERYQKTIQLTIERYGLNDPFILQYGRWLGLLVQGNLGFSPSAHGFVTEILLTRMPATAELILYSLLAFIPLGILSGVIAGYRQGHAPDWFIRVAAYIAASLPPFILALVLLSIFWVGLKWFPIGRLDISNSLAARSKDFNLYTGLLTIDGFLNHRADISLDALRHLVLPVITASLLHLSTLARITRAVTVDEMDKEYILAARGRGLPETRIVWKHAFPNVFVPAINSSILSAASLVTGLFVVESVFLFNGVSSMITTALGDVPDFALALGFVLFSVVVVLLITTILDILQALLDPLLREQGGLN